MIDAITGDPDVKCFVCLYHFRVIMIEIKMSESEIVGGRVYIV